MDLASLYFGLFLGIFAFTLAKIVQQTQTIWRHKRTLLNAYVAMIWVETWVNFVFALITYLFLNDVIHGSLGFYVASVILWAIQTQLLLQIVANRVALIMVERRKSRVLKWSLFIAVAVINIAVAVIWISAQMPGATAFQVMLNIIFEKAEKSFFLVVDLGLNVYFLYLVRYRLIADGLSKYWTLFKFNVAMVVLSAAMDCLLLGFLSLPDPYLYVQFSPVAYIVKLYIELWMAALIAKVVRSGSKREAFGMDASSGHRSNAANITRHVTSHVVISSAPAQKQRTKSASDKLWADVEARGSSSGSEAHLAPHPGDQRIVRTVETVVVVGDDSDSHIRAPGF